MQIFLGILITAISYLIYPFLKFKIICKQKYYSLERIHCELIINSIVICIAYLILQQFLTGTISVVNFTPALVYYYINVILHKNRNKKFNKKINKNVEEKKEIESIVELKEKKQEIKNGESLQINDTSSMAQNNIQQNNEKKIENENNFFLKILSVILGIFLLIAIIVIFSLLIKNEKQRLKIIEQEEMINGFESNDTFYKNLLEEMQNKIDFYDKYIVIIPQDSNYYMSYDCWDKKGRSHTFKIMNYKDAQSNGYSEYTCNIREKLGISE